MERIKISITLKTTNQCDSCNQVKPMDQFIGKKGKIIKRCLKCREFGLCLHGKTRTQCYLCFGKQAIANKMYMNCRNDDKRNQRPIGNITIADLLELLYAITNCPNCDIPFSYLGKYVDGIYQPNFVSLQRISNFRTHDKNNCTLYCIDCNQRDGAAHRNRDRDLDPIYQV